MYLQSDTSLTFLLSYFDIIDIRVYTARGSNISHLRNRAVSSPSIISPFLSNRSTKRTVRIERKCNSYRSYYVGAAETATAALALADGNCATN